MSDVWAELAEARSRLRSTIDRVRYTQADLDPSQRVEYARAIHAEAMAQRSEPRGAFLTVIEGGGEDRDGVGVAPRLTVIDGGRTFADDRAG
jgi:hypothetical protein